MVTKVLFLYLKKQNIFIMEDVWQVQILFITSQEEFIKLNVNIVIAF